MVPKVAKSKKKGILPKLKKDISSFAKSESGQISKQSMLTVGSVVGGAAIGAAIASKSAKGAGMRLFRQSGKTKHVDMGEGITLTMTPGGEIIGTHSHHASY